MSILSKTQQVLICKFNNSVCEQRNVYQINDQNPKNFHCLELIKNNTEIHTIFAIRKADTKNASDSQSDSQRKDSPHPSVSGYSSSASRESIAQNLSSTSLSSKHSTLDVAFSEDLELSEYKTFVVLNGAVKIAEQFHLTTQLVEWEVGNRKYLVLELKEYQRTLMLTILRRILETQHTLVALFDATSSKTSEWNIIRYATPGNMNHFDELISESEGGFVKAHEVCNVMAVFLQIDSEIGRMKVAFAAVNTLERLVTIGEICDDLQFNSLGDVLVSLNVKECLLYDNGVAKQNMHAFKSQMVMNNVELSLSSKKLQFDVDEGLRAIHILIRSKYISQAMYEAQNSPPSVNCIGAIADHLNLIQNEDNHNYFTLKTHNPHVYMRLNPIIMRELNVIPPASNKNSTSLFSHLDRCKTRIGSRLLSTWIRQPLTDENLISYRQDFVEALVDDPVYLENIHSRIAKFPDLDIIIKRMQQHKLSLKDIYLLYGATVVLPSLIQTLELGNLCNFLSTILSSLNNHVERFVNYQTMISLSLDLSKAKDGDFIINSSLNPHLSELMEDWKYLEGCIQTAHLKFCEACGVTDDMITLKRGKIGGVVQYYFKVPSHIGSQHGIVLDQKKKFSYITTEGMQNLSQAIMELMKEYEETQVAITKVINTKVSTFLPLFSELRDCIATIDVLAAFASVSAELGYTRPKLVSSSKNEIIMKDARHPLLENILEDRGKVIPNDVNISISRRFQIITGVNCGGKSTYLKMVGLLVIMSQIGCFIPANEGAVVSIRNAILVRIGASDSLSAGVSTFLQEMIESQSIISNTTSQSLVIIDELGRGTSTSDGFGISWSISEYLIQSTQAMCLFATHFHELTSLENAYQGVINLMVSVHQGNEFLMEYKIKEGISAESLGINVAKLAGFPENVLRIAQRKLHQIQRLKESRSEEYGSITHFTPSDTPLSTFTNNHPDHGTPTPKRRKLSFDSTSTETDEKNTSLVRTFLQSIATIIHSPEHLQSIIDNSEGIFSRFQQIKQDISQYLRNDREFAYFILQLKKKYAA